MSASIDVPFNAMLLPDLTHTRHVYNRDKVSGPHQSQPASAALKWFLQGEGLHTHVASLLGTRRAYQGSWEVGLWA
jgi:hypothetical protein